MNGFRIKGISYDDKLSKEQEEIVKRIKKEVDGKKWNAPHLTLKKGIYNWAGKDPNEGAQP
jgi:hypothetical protein